MQIVADPMRPDPELLALVQRIAELVRPDNVELAQWYGNYARQHAARIAHDVALVERYSTTQERVVDVAAVPLLLIGCLAARGRNVEGVDISPARFSQAIAILGVKVAACDIEREPLPFEDSSIDLLVFNEIFEHLRIDLIYTFSEIRRVLKAGAKLVMSTPNATGRNGHDIGRIVPRDPSAWKDWSAVERIAWLWAETNQTTTRFISTVSLDEQVVMYFEHPDVENVSRVLAFCGAAAPADLRKQVPRNVQTHRFPRFEHWSRPIARLCCGRRVRAQPKRPCPPHADHPITGRPVRRNSTGCKTALNLLSFGSFLDRAEFDAGTLSLRSSPLTR